MFFIQSTEMPMRAYSNTYGVPNDLNKLRMCKEIRETYDDLIQIYGDLISEQMKNEAFGMIFGYVLPDEYRWYFLSYILMRSYRMFDKSGNLIQDENYERILERIRDNDPHWEEPFVRRHDEWKSRLEVLRKAKPIRPSQ